MRAAIVRKQGYKTFILFPYEHKLLTIAGKKRKQKYVNGTMRAVWSEVVKNSRKATPREVTYAAKHCGDEIFTYTRLPSKA